MKQRYTQSNGRRPFGLSALIVGFDPHTNAARLFTTDPAGTYSEWKANAIGRSSKTVREFLEKNYKPENQNTGKTEINHYFILILLQDPEHKILRNQTIWIQYLDDACLKLACQALLEVVQSSSKNIELALMRSNSPLEIVPLERVTKLVEEIEAEKAAEAEKKKQQRAASKAARE